MKIKELFEDLIKSRIAAGVEIYLSPEGKRLYSCYILEKKGSSLKTVFAATELDIQQLAEKVNKLPVVLSVNGKGIIHKNVELTGTEQEQQLFNKVLPNAQPADFYLQKSPNSFLSIARKDIIDSLIAEFTGKLQVIKVILGPFAINDLAILLQGKEQLALKGSGIIFREGLIDTLIPAEEGISEQITIGNEKIDSQQLPAFAGAFSYFAGTASGIGVPEVTVEADNLRQKALFTLGGWSMLVFFLVTLIINYFFFNHYWTQKNHLVATVQANEQILGKLKSLEQEVEKKESFFSKNGLLENSKTSYFADRIALDLPASIILTSLNIHPALKNPDSDEVTSFDTKRINIAGLCQRSIELNNWIRILKDKSWVREVNILNYAQEKGATQANFHIELLIR